MSFRQNKRLHPVHVNVMSAFWEEQTPGMISTNVSRVFSPGTNTWSLQAVPPPGGSHEEHLL